jgi:uncharacterized protein (DUF2062 family)
MPRQFFTRISRQFREKKDHPWYLKPFEYLLAHPVYVSTSRRGIGGAVWVGLFIGFLPIPAHTFLSIVGALLLRVNVPIAAVTTWITNPLTFIPIMYFNYKVGAMLLNIPPETIPDDISMDWVMTEVELRWKPLIYGSLVIAISLASTAYLAISAIWHLLTMRRYRRRHARSIGSIKGGKQVKPKRSD